MTALFLLVLLVKILLITIIQQLFSNDLRGGIEINQFTQIRLILEAKFGNDPQKQMFILISLVYIIEWITIHTISSSSDNATA